MIIEKNKFKKNIKSINRFFKCETLNVWSTLKKQGSYQNFYVVLKHKFTDDFYTFINSLIVFPTTNKIKINFNNNTYQKIIFLILNITKLLFFKNDIKFIKIDLNNSLNNLSLINNNIFIENNINFNQLNLYIKELTVLINYLINNYYDFNDLYLIIQYYITFKFLKYLKNKNYIELILINFNSMISILKKYYKFYFNEFTYIINS